MEKLGFIYATPKKTGRKPYNPKDMCKLYTYGYFKEIRSSRKLEKEYHRNVEVIWLLKNLKPDFKTISDFRKDNKQSLTNLFKQFPSICKELGLYGKEMIAVDVISSPADQGQLYNIALQAKEELEIDDLTVLADKDIMLAKI